MIDVQKIYHEAEQKMQKTLEVFTKVLTKIRTDRAHPGLLDSVQIDYYNQRTPISRVANIIIEDVRTLSITPFDKNSMLAIEKAIATANLGLNPIIVGSVIKVPIPALTEERRKTLVKQIKVEVENARVAIRNCRKDANVSVKNLVNNKIISLNEKGIAENKIQKLTDQYIEKIEKLGANKEIDVMKV